MSISQKDIKIFGNLFVLEAANNHCGDIERGLKLIRDHAVVARQNNVRAAVKLQFRKMDTLELLLCSLGHVARFLRARPTEQRRRESNPFDLNTIPFLSSGLVRMTRHHIRTIKWVEKPV